VPSTRAVDLSLADKLGLVIEALVSGRPWIEELSVSQG
jgi:hypothetical protein